MNLILLKLVEHLGHTNALISGLAYDEVKVYREYPDQKLLTCDRFKKYRIIHISQQ